MFQVPDWGTDVPDNSINFAKSKQNKKGKKASILSKESPVKPQVNGNIQPKTTPKKSTDKRKLKKIRQKNREIYQQLSKPQHGESDTGSNNHQPGRFVLNPLNNESDQNNIRSVSNNNLNGEIYKNQEKLKKPKPPKVQKQRNKNQKVINALQPIGTVTKKPKKREHNRDPDVTTADLNNMDTDKADQLIFDAKKKKINDDFKNEDISFGEKTVETPKVKFNRKKEQIKKLLEKNSHRNSINVSRNSNSLRERMIAKLQAAQFRYLNEKLYTSTGTEAAELFRADPAAFDTYHQGYQQQIKKWPVNPLDVIVKRIMKMPSSHVIADMGCGSAALARRVPHAVRSFDLVAAAPGVQACDMARTPLPPGAVDAAVYCLALMGTQLADYLAEANRVLKTGGSLLIAEVESRFDSLEAFTGGVERLGFRLVRADRSHDVFYFLEFRKVQEASKKARHAPLTLKPCLYKRR